MAVQAIPFVPAMVAALNDRRKTQFRRHVSPQPLADLEPSTPHRFSCGDLLWVAERWRPREGLPTEAVRSPQDAVWAADNLDAAMCDDNWMPALALPQSASRFSLLVQSVGYQRIQDITPDECAKEGVCQDWFSLTQPIYTVPGTLVAELTARAAFRSLWIDLHGTEEAWAANPYVWRVEATLIRANVNVLLHGG